MQAATHKKQPPMQTKQGKQKTVSVTNNQAGMEEHGKQKANCPTRPTLKLKTQLEIVLSLCRCYTFSNGEGCEHNGVSKTNKALRRHLPQGQNRRHATQILSNTACGYVGCKRPAQNIISGIMTAICKRLILGFCVFSEPSPEYGKS